MWNHKESDISIISSKDRYSSKSFEKSSDNSDASNVMSDKGSVESILLQSESGIHVNGQSSETLDVRKDLSGDESNMINKLRDFTNVWRKSDNSTDISNGFTGKIKWITTRQRFKWR